MHVVHVAVAVVVDAVARDLARIVPDVRDEIRMGVVHTGIDDADDHVRITGECVPRELRANVGSRRPPRLPGVVQSPELRVAGIVRAHVGGPDPVRLGVHDVGARAQRRDRRLDRAAHAQAFEPGHLEAFDERAADVFAQRGAPRGARLGAKAHEHLARLEGRRRGGRDRRQGEQPEKRERMQKTAHVLPGVRASSRTTAAGGTEARAPKHRGRVDGPETVGRDAPVAPQRM
ncbi:MAG: hypothetical protein IPJ04_13930 [Candidatus Eisenbacteria bacterium]|nr:hypothetical protein [Candidatus Eisenbacteria bacterium]